LSQFGGLAPEFGVSHDTFFWQIQNMIANSWRARSALSGIVVAPLLLSGLVTPASAASTADLTWTVPVGVEVVQLTIVGASGGNISSATGGSGGKVTSSFLVNPRDAIRIGLGSSGANDTAGGAGGLNGLSTGSGGSGGQLTAFKASGGGAGGGTDGGGAGRYGGGGGGGGSSWVTSDVLFVDSIIAEPQYIPDRTTRSGIDWIAFDTTLLPTGTVGISYRVEVERIVFQNTGITQTMRGALIESVRTDLENVQTSAQARELSHRIWEQEEPQGMQHVSWWKVIQTSIFVNPYASVPVVLLWTMSAIGTLGLSIGFGRAIVQIAFSVVAISIMFWLGKKLNNVRWLPGLLVFILVMGATVFLTSVVASVLFDPRLWPAGLGLMISNALWLSLVTVLVGIAITAVRSSEQVIDTLESEVTQSELIQVATEREMDGLRKELASQLHGSVQSRLLITAALLDNGEFARVAPLIDPSITAEVLNALDTNPITSASEAINALAKSWQGLMRVDVELPDESVLRTRTEAIVRVVEEGLSNSFRHGKATEVSIRITAQGNSARIEVEDNGVGLSSEFVKGLGLTVIESLKPMVCELVNIPGAGCRMVVEFRS
jgi:hypothetical protein